nr:hypothetical protein [Tanacetum cinerariifolium]
LQKRINDSMIELRKMFQAWLQQQVVNLDSYTPEPSQYQKIPIYYDDDDDEERAQGLSHHRDEHLDTIPEKESDEFIKSSVENLVPNPSESEDLSNIGSECDVPVCDDFTIFSNFLFDADDNFSYSDDKSFSDEDVPKEIYSNPLFDEEIISIKIDSHHFNAESDLIEYLLNQDSSIIYSSKIDSLLMSSPDSLSLPENKSFHFNHYFDPSSPRPPAKPLDDDGIYFDDEPVTGILTAKVVGDISKHYVLMPRLLPAQPTLFPVIDTLLPFSSKNEDKVHLLSHQGFKAS